MKLTDTFLAIRYFGFFTLTKAVWYRVQRKTNFFRRKFPTTKWDQLQLPDFVKAETDLNDIKKLLRQSNFLPLTKQDDYLNKIFPVSNITESADEILDNNFTYFSKTKVQMGQNIDWHLNPFNSAQWPADIHWCSLSNFSPNHGDVKIVWEPSRFSWAYCLVRAYLATGQEKYAEKFWNLFESWLKANQPNLGINWGCGQECALRLMAWCFALFSLLDAPSTTEDRINKMLRALAVTADRIEKNISDAIRQKTNHAMTEAMGLYTVGTLFPFLIKADNWKKRGKQILEQQGLKQIYEDGSYLQQSMNYHRLMLQTYLWCLRIGQLNGDGFSQNLKDRLEKATEFLYQMQDDSTGRVPNYGANDGALILPLNTCEYLDYRPVIQSCQYLLKQEKLYDVGPWDEDLLWLFGPDAAKKTTTIKQRTSSQFPIGGYYTLRSPKTWAMIRCHSYRDRVGHVDLLSMDFWADGLNLLCDCGSYKYFAPNEAQLQKYFKSIWAHNTIIVDDTSPLRLFSRFIYLPWPKAQLNEFNVNENKGIFNGTGFAYNRKPWHIKHRRQVTFNNDSWQISDELLGKGKHKLELRWHSPAETEIASQTSNSVTFGLTDGWLLQVKGPAMISADILRSDIKGGWQSLYYNHKQPSSTLTISTNCLLPNKLTTHLYRN